MADWYQSYGRPLASGVWKFAIGVAQYYWAMRQPLGEYIAGCLPDLASESVRMREVRLSPDESYRMAEFGPEGWKVSIPGRCVVCGERSNIPPIDETLLVENAAPAFWIPAAAAFFGLTVGWFLFGRWFSMLSVPLGFAAGYLLRSKVPVFFRLVRCDQHATRLNIPHVRAGGSTLILRFGHKTLRKVFLYGETMDFAIPQPAAVGADSPLPDVPPDPPYEPETIPLADSPDPKDSQIKHDLPPAFGLDDETKYNHL